MELDVKIKFLLCLLILLVISCCIYAEEFSGDLSIKYSNQKEKGENYNVLESYLSFDTLGLYKRYLTLNFDGKFTYNDSANESSYNTDIYALYMNFSTFEKKMDIKAGRFSHINNKFMTIDGIDFRFISDYFLGIDIFGGIPKYITKDDRYINQEFRDTGDRIYGFKLFSNDLKDLNGFVGYSKELDSEKTVQEILSAGIGFKYKLTDKIKMDIKTSGDYELTLNQLYRGDIKADFSFYDLNGYLSATKFNVKDGYSADRKLIISNFSTGKEERYSYHLEYPINKYFKIYHGLTHTYLQYNSGEWGEGEIIELGIILSMIEKYGLLFDFGGYRYDSIIADANGISANIDWYLNNNLKNIFKFEYVDFQKWDYSKNIYFLSYELSYDITKKANLSAFIEKSSRVVYLPERKIGVKFQWNF